MGVRRYDVCMELLLIALAAAAASAVTLISGFGLSTALVPVFALYFPLPLAIAAVAVVHLLNSLFKVVIMRSDIDWPVTLRFGVPAAASAARCRPPATPATATPWAVTPASGTARRRG